MLGNFLGLDVFWKLVFWEIEKGSDIFIVIGFGIRFYN